MDDWLGYARLLAEGAVVTVLLALGGGAIALVVAFAAGLARLSRQRSVRWTAVAFVEFFRGTSVYVQLFWIFYVLPFMGLRLPAMLAGVLTLGLNVGAFASEIVRSSINAVPRSQVEACTALNFTRWQSFRHVVLPQALRLMLPPFGNQVVELIKISAVVSLITVADITFQAQLVRSATGNTVIPYTAVLVFYFVLAMSLVGLIRLLERHMARRVGIEVRP